MRIKEQNCPSDNCFAKFWSTVAIPLLLSANRAMFLSFLFNTAIEKRRTYDTAKGNFCHWGVRDTREGRVITDRRKGEQQDCQGGEVTRGGHQLKGAHHRPANPWRGRRLREGGCKSVTAAAAGVLGS